MYQNFKVLALIPARGGSKGIPGKNIRLLAGKPLIAHSIEQAKASKYVDRVIISTDDEKITQVAREFGAEVPFMRPAEIAQDLTPDFPAFEHCLDWLKEYEGYEPDIVVHLRPTGPLRTSKQIDDGIELLAKYPEADSVRSVNEPPKSPYKMWVIGENFMKPLLTLEGTPEPYNAPQQTLPKVYQTNPNIGVMWKRTLREKKSVIGQNVLPLIIKEPVVDIDKEIDLRLAELLLEKRNSA